MKKAVLFLSILFIYSCIPVKIAPNIEDNKVMLAKKFKRQLPKNYAFIFEDPKDENEFYEYIKIKYELNDDDLDLNVPIEVNKKEYSMSFHETERETKTLNLVPMAIDAKRESNGNDPILEDAHVSRIGNWYLVLSVYDKDGNDCLSPDYKERQQIIDYLKNLKSEYLSTANYYDALFKKKS